MTANRQLDWVDRMQALTVVGEREAEDPVALAERVVADLAVSAGAVSRRAAPTAFADLPRGETLRLLAVDLSGALPLSGPQQSRAAAIDQRDVVVAYLEALSGAAPAVSWCRRLAHPCDCCWFDPQGFSEDLCGRILTCAHHASASARLRARQRWDQTGEPR